jgi:hypothetical protein
MNLKSLLFFAVFLSPFVFSAQTLNPVKWQAQYTDLANNEGEITITANIEKAWHIYSQDTTSAGPIPTSFNFTPGSNFKLIGKTIEAIKAKEEFVKAFEAKLHIFEEKAVFKQKINRLNNKAFTILFKLEYMTCNDMQCLPPKTVELNVAAPAVSVKK